MSGVIFANQVSLQTMGLPMPHDGAGADDLAKQPWLDLLIEVDFKWLMVGQGRCIDPTRVRHAPGGANHCLRSALASPCEELKSCAQNLRQGLQQVAPTAEVQPAPCGQ